MRAAGSTLLLPELVTPCPCTPLSCNAELSLLLGPDPAWMRGANLSKPVL